MKPRVKPVTAGEYSKRVQREPLLVYSVFVIFCEDEKNLRAVIGQFTLFDSEEVSKQMVFSGEVCLLHGAYPVGHLPLFDSGLFAVIKLSKRVLSLVSEA